MDMRCKGKPEQAMGQPAVQPAVQPALIRHGINKIAFFLITACIVFLPFYSVSSAKGLNLFRIGTGGKTGVYYPIGKIIARGISDAARSIKARNPDRPVPACLGIAQNSGGSVDNVRSIMAGDIEAGLVQADVAAWAHGGRHIFKGNTNTKDLRAIAGLYPELFHVVMRRDAAIKTIYDLRGKRISVDEPGSGTLAVMRIVLDAYNLSEKDLKPVYLKPVFTHRKIVSGNLHGFVMMAGTPMTAVEQLLDAGITLLPIALDKAVKIAEKYPYLVPGKIPADIYPGVPETKTVQVYALLATHKTMDENLIYQITEALWSKHMISLLRNGHPQGKSISVNTALRGISIPLHRGAKKYYQHHAQRFGALVIK